MRQICWVIVLLLAGMIVSGVSADTRFVFHSQGFLTPRQNVYYHFFQFTDPSDTIGLLGPLRQWDIQEGNIKGLIWFKADDDGDAWTGVGFWPSISLTDRLSFDLDSRYLLGWGDTPDQIQLVPWIQYRLNDRNSIRLQAALTEIQGDGESQSWFLGPFWIYDIGGGRQFRLGYQEGLEGEPEPRVVVEYNFNL